MSLNVLGYKKQGLARQFYVIVHRMYVVIGLVLVYFVARILSVEETCEEQAQRDLWTDIKRQNWIAAKNSRKFRF